jgi:hypothetical protein
MHIVEVASLERESEAIRHIAGSRFREDILAPLGLVPSPGRVPHRKPYCHQFDPFFSQPAPYRVKPLRRRIDTEWLAGSAELALQMEGHTNNTSLALAIE